MTPELWIAFAAASAVLLVIPGPTVLTVISYSIAHGGRVTAPLITAVALGDSTALVLSLAGLGALLSVSAFWFTVVKWAGGLYLLFLGISMLVKGQKQLTSDGQALQLSRRKLFLNTYVVTALNPKGIVFFIAFLPQFVNPSAGIAEQLWILGATFVALATISATMYAVFAGSASQVFRSSVMQRRFRLCGGALLSGTGLWVLLARKPVSI